MLGSQPQWFVVARREFLERVRTPWFLIVTLLGPVAMIGMIVIPAWLSATSSDTVELRVLDRSGRDLGPGVAEAVETVEANLRAELAERGASEDDLLAAIGASRIDGFLVFPEDTLDGGTVVYRGDNATNMQFVQTLHAVVNTAVRSVRGKDAGFSDQQIASLLTPTAFDARHTTGQKDGTSGTASFIVGYAVMFILYMAIMLYAVNVLRSVVQEKTSRVVEIVVSAVRPRSLMGGKILGVGGVGLVQLLVWAGMALVLLTYRSHVLGLFGVSGADFDVPSLDVVSLALVLSYFLLGFFFYASLLAAVGAMVNSDQEAQQAQTPVVLLLVIPLMCVNLVTNDPRGMVAQVLTLVPLSSPVLMPMRYLLGGASAVDVAMSLALLALAIAGAVFVAARIYRVGILSHGKRPSLRELARWIAS